MRQGLAKNTEEVKTQRNGREGVRGRPREWRDADGHLKMCGTCAGITTRSPDS